MFSLQQQDQLTKQEPCQFISDIDFPPNVKIEIVYFFVKYIYLIK